MRLLQKKLSKFDEPQKVKAAGIYPYFRAISSEQDTEVIMNGKRVLMFGSNSYLGLTNHPKVKEAAIEATRKYGTGMAGSRFLNGTLDIHEELEHRLAKFVGKEEALVFSTGMQVNIGVVPALVGKDDYIIWDELDHASIVEGIRLSFANTMKFKHNDMAMLERRLQSCASDKIKLIVVDGVFSMEGDITPLQDIVCLAKKYDANIYVDEAHSFGVFGQNGQGLCHHLGLTSDVDLMMGTFSKSFASIGGFIATDSVTMNWLKHRSRTYIFSASPTPAAIGAANASLEIMMNEPERFEHLWEITNYALNGFRSLNFEIGNTSTPIIPLFVRDNEKTFMITKDLFEDGIFVNPVVTPAVSPKDTLIRFSLMATHTHSQIDYALDKIHTAFKRYGVIV